MKLVRIFQIHQVKLSIKDVYFTNSFGQVPMAMIYFFKSYVNKLEKFFLKFEKDLKIEKNFVTLCLSRSENLVRFD